MSLSNRFTSYRPFGIAIGFGSTVAIFSFAIGMPLQVTWVDNPSPDQTAFFESKVRPILVENCVSCHGKSNQSAGLRLDTRDGLRKGGVSGPTLVPGDSAKSLLLMAVHQNTGLKMPPGKKLKASEIADLETWIKLGAPWPATSSTKENQPKLWSLQPVRVPAVPKVSNPNWIKNPLDAFILAKLDANKLKPSNAADNRTFLRRVTFDLTGLPPTAAEMEAFLGDKSPNAYEMVIDRLLASPRYGERWARHWLDVARYADTKGYVFEEDRNYYNAYTYRDWVINAFNRDLPYDQFITQQLAADRLPQVQNGDDKRALAALGFLTIGRRFLNNTPDIIDDRIDATMRGFQGFTVACARCHDHKFDPIPTQDYYSLYAVFDSSNEQQAPISEKAIRDPWIQHNQKVTEMEVGLRKLALDEIARLRQKLNSVEEAKSIPSGAKEVLQGLREGQLPDDQKAEKLIAAFEPTVKENLNKARTNLAALKKTAPPLPEFAMAMQDAPNPHDGVVFKRGNPGNRGEVAPRRFLLALSKEERPLWKAGSGRLELAQSIASRENPLTARVFVNRVWQYHFGAGLVRTPSDFGFQGEKPTHPELLDYLASTFMDNGWSIKKLQKTILMSATYRQSSSVSATIYNADPENRLWSRMNRQRLELEEMRDAFMAASGKLDIASVGGKSVDLWAKPFTGRRAVYGYVDRQNLPGVFRTFDFASPDSTSPRRFLTTVPQQALFFMNSPFAIEQARSVTERSELRNAKSEPDRIRQLYRVLFARQPNADELLAGGSYLNQGSQAIMKTPNSLWQYGYGEYDAERRRVSSFVALSVFTDGQYRVGKVFPDPVLGYIALNAVGGHPGHDAAHAVIRRWIAPESMTVRVRGNLVHQQNQGDGVRARVVSTREGLLGEWQAKNQTQRTDLNTISLQKGDTLDFVIDPIANDGFDSFAWSPKIERVDGKQSWDASANFAGPAEPGLTRLALYAQALMMTNEFMFVD